jgi:ABC-type multidrug transport system fused ATPase/permease subunit
MKILDFFKKPFVAALLAFIVGLVIGLVVLGWGLWPLQWKDASPAYLNADYATDYLRMAIDSYIVNSNEALAIQRYQALGSLGPGTLEGILQNPGDMDRNAIQNFNDVIKAGAVLMPGTTETTGGSVSKGMSVAIIVIILVLVGVVGFFLFKYILPLFRKFSSEGSAAQRAKDLTSQTQMTNYEEMGEEPPIAQFMTTYVLGDDLFDDSFSIEAQSGEFLGECGIGISETIGVGDPKKVTAFEVWLFDKNDIQTVTKVLMSNHAFNDQATFQRLEAKGEPFLLEPGKQVVLETKALQLVAVVSEMKYAEDALPESSYMERLTLELAVWPKEMLPE